MFPGVEEGDLGRYPHGRKPHTHNSASPKARSPRIMLRPRAGSVLSGRLSPNPVKPCLADKTSAIKVPTGVWSR